MRKLFVTLLVLLAHVGVWVAVATYDMDWAGRMEYVRGTVGPTLAWILGITIASIIGIIILGRIVSAIMKFFLLSRPPVLEATPPILSAEVTHDGDRRTIGKSWITRRNGIHQVYLEGDSFTIGYSSARLTSDLMYQLEESFLATARTYVPWETVLWIIGHIVMIKNHHLPRFISDELKMEIFGLSKGHKNHHPEMAPLYNRLLGYHAAHDIGHSLEDTGIASTASVEDSTQKIRGATGGGDLKVGCTAFAAWGSHVENGHVIVGRNCDLEGGPAFDVDKLVSLIRPDEGNAFITVSWCGWLGVATGMNDKRIFISLNAAHTGDKRSVGEPVALVVRKALQYGSTMEEAIQIIRDSEVFVNDGFLLADGNEGKVVIVEKSPYRCDVLESDSDYLISANHFYTDTFRDDPANQKFMKTSTSVARYDRMKELVEGEAGKINIETASKILRNRRGKNDLDVGSGCRATVNPLIATHSVIADVTAGMIWVAAAPHQLGEYSPFGIEDFAAMPDEPVIPEDPFLTSGGYDDYLQSEQMLARGEALFKKRQITEAKEALSESQRLNPEYYRSHMLLGRVALREGYRDEAVRRFQTALDRQPPFLRHREELQALLAKAQKL